MISTILLPLMAMNLRAQMDREVTITDASPTGGGGAVSSSFKDVLDKLQHDGQRCHVCEGGYEKFGKFSCPAGCGVVLCSLSCIWNHCKGQCPRRDYTLPRFGERFAGPRARLTHEVARMGGFDVQEPFDYKTGDDFFSDEGRKKLEELENDELLAAEHWAPECRLFSRARGKPVKLPSGEVIQGPQPVRDAKHVMGFRWLSAEMKVQLRRSNKMALRGLKRAEENLSTKCVTTLEHPWGSWLWYFSIVDKLTDGSFRFAEGTSCCFGGSRVKWYALLGNSREIHRELHRPNCPGHEGLQSYDVRRRSDGSLQFATEEESEYKVDWCVAYAQGLRREAEIRGWILHAESMVTRQLLQSTQRLKNREIAYKVGQAVTLLEVGMKPGSERDHLKEMVRQTSIRGSDIYVCTSKKMPTRFLILLTVGTGKKSSPTHGTLRGISTRAKCQPSTSCCGDVPKKPSTMRWGIWRSWTLWCPVVPLEKGEAHQNLSTNCWNKPLPLPLPPTNTRSSPGQSASGILLGILLTWPHGENPCERDAYSHQVCWAEEQDVEVVRGGFGKVFAVCWIWRA